MFSTQLLSYEITFGEKKGFLDTMNDIDPDGTMFMTLIGSLFFAAIVAGIIAIVWISKKKQINQNILGANDYQTQPTQSIKARVVNKVDAPSKVTNTGPLYADPYAHIMFEDENGARADFAIADTAKYNSIIVGDVGVLTFAGRAFIDFQRVNYQNTDN